MKLGTASTHDYPLAPGPPRACSTGSGLIDFFGLKILSSLSERDSGTERLSSRWPLLLRKL